jgi:UDP-N-acetyl-D-mannosaminuronic acid dehydrogenase
MAETVCVVGLGYIGLPTAAVLAARGFTVHGVEVNPRAIEEINAGRAHFAEPDLDMLVQAGVQTGRLKAHAEPVESDVFIICVPTPLTAEDQPDLQYVEQATEAICPHIRKGSLVVLESTSPPGTTEWIAGIIRERTGLEPPDIFLAHAPERVLPGRILREVVENDRIVGGIDEASTQACAAFYGEFASGDLLLTTARTAEATKLVENAFRDVNIAFANELSLVAEELDLDVWKVIQMANRHPRVNILGPGPGVGGHCIPVDPWFLIAAAPASTSLMRAAREINDRKPHWVVERVAAHADRFKRPCVACLGLTYKADVDDLRESPAVEVASALSQAIDGEVLVVEPNLETHPDFRLTEVHEAIRKADILVFLVGHSAFLKLPPAMFEEKIVVDTCGVLRL